MKVCEAIEIISKTDIAEPVIIDLIKKTRLGSHFSELDLINVITIILTFVVALTAFNTVEGQVENNKKSIDEAKVATNEMQQSVHTLTIDVALLKRDAENAAQQREEIKANQTQIINLLQAKAKI